MKKINNILVIDNDPVANFVSEKIINHLDITEHITTFTSGEEALEYLKEECIQLKKSWPELVLLDLDMPCMNGFQFLKALRKLDVSHTMEIVILSTSLYPKNIELAKSKGLKFYVAKPLNVEKMQEIYDTILKVDTNREFTVIQ